MRAKICWVYFGVFTGETIFFISQHCSAAESGVISVPMMVQFIFSCLHAFLNAANKATRLPTQVKSMVIEFLRLILKSPNITTWSRWHLIRSHLFRFYLIV